MSEINLLDLQITAILFLHSCEIIFLRMIVPVIYVSTSLIYPKNPCECSCVSLLVPDYIIIGAPVGSSTAEGDFPTNCPGQRQILLNQLCCHGNQRCRQTDR